MIKVILSTLFVFVFQVAFSQTNLLAKSRQDFVFDHSIKNWTPISEIKEALNKFEFKSNPHIVSVSDVSIEPILSTSYSIISVENDVENDLINFTINDLNSIEYSLLLSVKKNLILLIHEKYGKTFMTKYVIVTP